MEELSGLRSLAGAVAQEVLNPLSTAGLHAELLLDSLPEGDPRRGSAEAVRREVRRVARNLELLRVFAGCREDGRGAIDLAPPAERARADPELEGPAAAWREAPPPLDVRGDRDLLKGAVAGLIADARRSALPDRPPRLRAGRDGREVWLEVEVPGVLPPRAAHRAFDGSSPRGLGLGPALAREAARASGGSFLTRAGREGVVFHLRLPRGERGR